MIKKTGNNDLETLARNKGYVKELLAECVLDSGEQGEDEKKRSMDSFLFEKVEKDKSLLWGADTMNTLKTYEVQIEKFRKENFDKVDIMCSRCHQLGNFVLVPVY